MRSIKTVLVLAGVVALAVVASGCSRGTTSVRAQQSPSRGIAPSESPDGLCEPSQDEVCFRLATGQWASVRHPSPAKNFVLLDVGGPGSANADTSNVEASFPAWLKEFSVVTIHEPWVGRDLTEGCQKYFAHLSWSLPATDPEGCVDFVSTLTQPPMVDAVAQVSQKLGQNLAGVVTFSFGATRTQELWPTLGMDQFLVLVQPAPSAAVPIDSIISARAAAAWDRLDVLRAASCPAQGSCLSISELRERLASPSPGSMWHKGKTELTLFLLGAVLDLDRNAPLVIKLFTNQELSTEEESSVRRVAMAFSHTLDQDHALPSNAGFRSAICQAYGTVAKRSSGDPLEDAFRAQVNLCGEKLNPLAKAVALPLKSCLLVNRTDPALPIGLMDRVSSFGPSNTVEYHSTGHTWPASEFSKLTLALASARASCSASAH